MVRQKVAQWSRRFRDPIDSGGFGPSDGTTDQGGLIDGRWSAQCFNPAFVPEPRAMMCRGGNKPSRRLLPSIARSSI